MRSAGALNGLTYVLATCCDEVAGNACDLHNCICIPSVSDFDASDGPGLYDIAIGHADIRLIGARRLSNENPKAPSLVELRSHLARNIIKHPLAKLNEAICWTLTMIRKEWRGAILVNRVPVKDGGNMLNHPSDNWMLISQSDFEPRFQRGLQCPEEILHGLHCAFCASIGCALAHSTELTDGHSKS